MTADYVILEQTEATRNRIADELFAKYDFGIEVEDSDGWERETPGTVLTRVVYLVSDENGSDGEEDRATLKAYFTVVFDSVESCNVKDVYAITVNGEIFGSLPD